MRRAQRTYLVVGKRLVSGHCCDDSDEAREALKKLDKTVSTRQDRAQQGRTGAPMDPQIH